MVAAIIRNLIGFIKKFEVIQVMLLHSALSKSNMQVHNLRKSGDGRYLVRVSAPHGAVGFSKSSSFANAGIGSRITGRSERIENDAKFAEYFTDAMMGIDTDADMNAEGIDLQKYDGSELAVYTEFSGDRKIAARKPADWGLQALLSSFGCDVEDAEMISDAGYGSQWIAVAFSPA